MRISDVFALVIVVSLVAGKTGIVKKEYGYWIALVSFVVLALGMSTV